MPKQYFHLPDLPNVGYATARERALSDNIMEFMRQVERDRDRLLSIVIDGKERWRKVAGDIWRGYRISEEHEALDAIFRYFELQAVRPKTQYLLMRCLKNPAKWRDIMRIVMPHIEKEREQLRLMKKWSPN